MNFWMLIQILFDIVLLSGVIMVWARLSRPAKDDPRLSRGLQILQSKISILEDLSDRVETQVQQLNSLMEQKAKEVQSQLLAADKQIQKIDVSMNKSLEVAQIFQDKIPHTEIVERQNSLKYIKAAKLAHQGFSVDEITAQVDLSRGEIDFIVKVNREHLQFSEEALPEWAKANSISPDKLNSSSSEKLIPTPERSLSNLGQKFRSALGGESIQEPAPKVIPTALVSAALVTAAPLAPSAPAVAQNVAKPPDTKGLIRKVVFPRIDMNRGLE